MTDGFRDKVALVTGGSSGIGRATSLAFAREGARVAIADREPTGAAETASMIEEIGGSATVFELDVTKANDVASVIDRVVQTYGRLDCAFNNAGIGGEVAKTADYPEEEWDRIIDVNLKGVWLCMKYEIPVMEKQGSGAIVNTASIYGLAGAAGYIAYNAAKHGGCRDHQDRCIGVCNSRYTNQRRLPRLHPHTNDPARHRRKSRLGTKDGFPDTYGETGYARGDRRGRRLAMLGCRLIRYWTHHDAPTAGTWPSSCPNPPLPRHCSAIAHCRSPPSDQLLPFRRPRC